MPRGELLVKQVILERKRKRIAFYTFVVIFLIYILINLIGNNGLFTYLSLKERKNAIEKEIASLREENARLRAYIEALKSDPYYIEKLAREEYGLSKPGEYIFEYEK